MTACPSAREGETISVRPASLAPVETSIQWALTPATRQRRETPDTPSRSPAASGTTATPVRSPTRIRAAPKRPIGPSAAAPGRSTRTCPVKSAELAPGRTEWTAPETGAGRPASATVAFWPGRTRGRSDCGTSARKTSEAASGARRGGRGGRWEGREWGWFPRRRRRPIPWSFRRGRRPRGEERLPAYGFSRPAPARREGAGDAVARLRLGQAHGRVDRGGVGVEDLEGRSRAAPIPAFRVEIGVPGGRRRRPEELDLPREGLRRRPRLL